METRRLGRTGHKSTIITFGTAAFWEITQREADRCMELVFEHGVNHIDVAPEYGEAEVRIGPWIEKYRKNIFLGCKTFLRTKEEVREELHRSLDRLRTDHFDLYQLHQVDTPEELKTVLGPGGAMEAVLEARSQGLLKNIGITGHHLETHIRAVEMFDFDTLMIPMNFIFYADVSYRGLYNKLMRLAAEKDRGVLIIKSITRGNWEGKYEGKSMRERPYTTWYRPFDTRSEIDRSLRFVLSQNVSTAVSAGDVRLLPKILEAAERFTPMSEKEQEELLSGAKEYRLLKFTF
ncbi:MAG: aldo/keto reductase [Spirochaetes bacterium]|nr:aldo/keto reductase [Spirochaetota bacterium]